MEAWELSVLEVDMFDSWMIFLGKFQIRSNKNRRRNIEELEKENSRRQQNSCSYEQINNKPDCGRAGPSPIKLCMPFTRHFS